MTDDTLDEDRIRELQALTAQLPREIEPPADAWGAIVKAIAESAEGAETAEKVRGSGGTLWQRPAFLAAAALLLVAGSSAITAIALGRRAPAAQTGTVAMREYPRPSAATPATLAEFTLRENDYIDTANRLSAILDSEETQLTPETIAKLKESLRVIDAAILEARRALATDPANRELVEMLSTSYEHKVDLLRRTTEMGRS